MFKTSRASRADSITEVKHEERPQRYTKLRKMQ